MFSPTIAMEYVIVAEARDPRLLLLVIGGVLVLAGFQLWPIYKRMQATKRLQTSGMVTRAWIVQANDALYQKGHFNRPALLIASLPGKTGASNQEMQAMAEHMFRLRETKPRSEAEKKVQGIVLDEGFVENLGGRLPMEFTGGKSVHWFHLRIDRRSLPGGVLELPYVQIRALEEPKSGELTCIMVPYSQGG